MIVLIEQDRHWSITGDFSRLPHHLGDSSGLLDAVAVQEEVVGRAHDIFLRDDAAAVAGANEEAATVARAILDAFNQFMHALGLENLVVVANVALVIHFDEDVAIAL